MFGITYNVFKALGEYLAAQNTTSSPIYEPKKRKKKKR